MRPTERPALTAEEVEALATAYLDARTRGDLERFGGADLSLDLPGGDRFRLSVYRERNKVSLAARRVNRAIPTFEELHLPAEVLAPVCERRQGLVVFCGATGCGKSTSLAACLGHINRTRRCHIVTIEDPIEHLFEDDQAFVSQREIGTDVTDFDTALKSLMRSDPDVVLVGETRDRITCESVLRATETGHLVFTTVHASSAPGAVARVMDLFPDEVQETVRATLAQSLEAVVCQQLVPSCRQGVAQVPACEVMLATPAVRKALREADETYLGDLVAGGGDLGMRSLTQDLAARVKDGWVDSKTAQALAPRPEALKMALRGIQFKEGTVR